jgi:hypothetical protein
MKKKKGAELEASEIYEKEGEVEMREERRRKLKNWIMRNGIKMRRENRKMKLEPKEKYLY